MISPRNQEIVDRYRGGETAEQIGAAHGLSPQRVHQIIMRYMPDWERGYIAQVNHHRGVRSPELCEAHRSGTQNPPGAWTKAQDAQLIAGAEGGKSYSEVAVLLGKSRNAIAGRAHRIGVVFHCDRQAELAREAVLKRWRDVRAQA